MQQLTNVVTVGLQLPKVVDIGGLLVLFKTIDYSEDLGRFENEHIAIHLTRGEALELRYEPSYSTGTLLVGEGHKWEVVFKTNTMRLDTDEVAYSDDDITLSIPRHSIMNIRHPFSLSTSYKIISHHFTQAFKHEPFFECHLPVGGLEGMDWEYILEKFVSLNFSGEQLVEFYNAVAAIRGFKLQGDWTPWR